MIDTQESRAIAALIADNKQEILDSWISEQIVSRAIRIDLLGEETLREQCRDFLDRFEKAVRQGGLEDPSDPAYESVKAVLNEVSDAQVACGLAPSGTAAHVLALKDALLGPIQRHGADDPAHANRQALVIFRLLDQLALVTVDAYAKGRQDYIAGQAREILTASVPVVQVWQGIVLAPLIGSLDSQRTQSFMEEILERISATNSKVALVDITGVAVIDTQTAHHLIETMSAVRLLGARMVLTGVRPAIAQTLVHLGVDLSGMITRPSVAAGLQATFELLGLEVVERNPSSPRGAHDVC